MIKQRRGCPFTVLVCIYYGVFTGFIQRRRCHVELWCRRGYELVSIWFLFSFCSVEMKMGGGFVSALWFGLKIIYMVFWIEDNGSLVMASLCWMHISIQHDWF